jgi:phage terminase small subunit
MPRKRKKLTRRQKLFVKEYLQDRNATQAAIRAGYSPASARSTGHKLTHTPHVRRKIAQRLEQMMKADKESKPRIVQELSTIAYFDPRDVVKWDDNGVTLVPSADIPDEIIGAVKAVKETRDGIHVIFHDKIRALELLDKIRREYIADEGGRDVAGGDVHFTLQIGDRILQPGRVPARLQRDAGVDLEKIAKGPDLLLEPGETAGDDDDEDGDEW